MDRELIKTLIDALAGSDLAELEFSTPGGDSLRLVKNGAVVEAPRRASVSTGASAATAAVPASQARTSSTPKAASPVQPTISNEVRAPLYGVLHLQPSPGEPPFVSVGQSVEAGQTLCVIEAMKVFNQVLAERSGVIEAVLVATGVEVDAGQPLFTYS
ncbi:MAG: acetyl-CoA carboxylase, biotin carboxyl carrier protein [Rhizobacter sp.]|nr:acetyl-CoA carboxylase, biotin carboxyl carrier protein [Rhizobacter sp.]